MPVPVHRSVRAFIMALGAAFKFTYYSLMQSGQLECRKPLVVFFTQAAARPGDSLDYIITQTLAVKG